MQLSTGFLAYCYHRGALFCRHAFRRNFSSPLANYQKYPSGTVAEFAYREPKPMNRLAKKLGKRISKFRRERGVTSEKLAYENGISKGYLSDIENGKRLPSLTLLEKIARGLGIGLRDLF